MCDDCGVGNVLTPYVDRLVTDAEARDHALPPPLKRKGWSRREPNVPDCRWRVGAGLPKRVYRRATEPPRKWTRNGTGLLQHLAAPMPCGERATISPRRELGLEW